MFCTRKELGDRFPSFSHWVAMLTFHTVIRPIVNIKTFIGFTVLKTFFIKFYSMHSFSFCTFLPAGSENHMPDMPNHVNILWFYNHPTFLYISRPST